MKGQLSKQISIARNIIDGSITIGSVKEFQGMLQLFPNDPALHRAYADFLVRKQSSAAVNSYHRAARLFAASGLLLQAIVCQRIKWQIREPAPEESQKFWLTLHKSRYHELSTNIFFTRLSHKELMAVMNVIELIRLPAGKTVNKIGDEENAIYFIVSGNIKATTFEPLEKTDVDHRKTIIDLSDSDFFGDIYPLDENKLSHYYTETISRVELVRLSRKKLLPICRKYANVELAIIDLLKTRSETADLEAMRSVRKAHRHKLPVKMDLKIWPWPSSADHYGLVLEGLSRNISVGGMCIVLDAKYTNVPSIYKNIQNAKIEVSIPSESITLNVLGSIVWSKEVVDEEQRTVALGIRFEKMSPQMSGLVVVFANSLNKTG